MRDGFTVIDWHIHAIEAEYFEKYPQYDKPFWEWEQPFIRKYGEQLISKIKIPLSEKIQLFKKGGIDRAVFIGLDLYPYFDFKVPIEYMAWLEKRYPDYITSIPCLNPARGIEQTLADIEEAASYGIKGIKFFPCFYGNPSDRKYYSIYQKLLEHKMIAMFHMGHQIRPGKLEWCRPGVLDQMAQDFEELPIVVAHIGNPWYAETIVGLARLKPNIYFDTASLSAKAHFCLEAFMGEQGIYKYVEVQMPERILFGSDYPNTFPPDTVDDFLMIMKVNSDEFKRGFFAENARRLLRI